MDELRAGVAAVLAPSEAEALGAWLAAKAASLDEHGQADGPRVSLRVSRDHDETGGLGMDDYTRAAEMTAQLTQKGGVLDYGPERSRLLVRVLRTLALGSPVTSPDVEALAHEAGLTPPEAQAFLRQVTERDAADRIIGVLGLSLGAHPHRFSVNGQRLSTWCAEDTLFLPALLGETATVESTSPISREPVRLTIGPEGVQAVSPAGAVVSIALVDPDQTPFQSVEAIWMTFCRHIYFFASREEAERWAAGRRDIAILTPHEGYRIGRQLADRFLAVAA